MRLVRYTKAIGLAILVVMGLLSVTTAVKAAGDSYYFPVSNYGTVSFKYTFNDPDFGVRTKAVSLSTDQKNHYNYYNGYNFIDDAYTASTTAPVFVTYRNGQLYFASNPKGKSGVYQMSSYTAKMRPASSRAYIRTGVLVKKDATYAVYDAANNAYIKIRVSAVTLPVIAKPLEAPTVFTPNKQLVNYPRIIQPTWTPVKNAVGYRIEVDCDACGGGAKWSNVQYKYFYNVSTVYNRTDFVLPGDNTYRIRVQALDAYGTEGKWSSFVYFSYKTSYTSAPVAPHVVYPYDNAQLGSYSYLSVDWDNDGAPKHTIEVTCKNCGANATTFTTVSNYARYADLPKVVGTYVIRVKATNDNNVDSAWSEPITATYTSSTQYYF